MNGLITRIYENTAIVEWAAIMVCPLFMLESAIRFHNQLAFANFTFGISSLLALAGMP